MPLRAVLALVLLMDGLISAGCLLRLLTNSAKFMTSDPHLTKSAENIAAYLENRTIMNIDTGLAEREGPLMPHEKPLYVALARSGHVRSS